MKYVIGIIGFVFVFSTVYLIITYGLVAWHPNILAKNFPIVVQGNNNPIGLFVALLAGVSSFRASVKHAGQRAGHESNEERVGLPSWVGYLILTLIMIGFVVAVALL